MVLIGDSANTNCSVARCRAFSFRCSIDFICNGFCVTEQYVCVHADTKRIHKYDIDINIQIYILYIIHMHRNDLDILDMILTHIEHKDMIWTHIEDMI